MAVWAALVWSNEKFGEGLENGRDRALNNEG